MGFIQDLLSVPQIRKELEKTMAQVADLTTAVNDLSLEVVRVQAEVADLKAHQGGIQPAELDPVLVGIQGATAALKAL